ncbi:SGNH/GDSL hydrolase family protein [Spirosoma sp. BT702]|uniref:SGNH/GDSL hydrolase family protein n=1 Tax=Spirosoma profusum TaxID=2771354 RepID=A0A927AT24_9BACT|nr:SGNH/GDSL hydrolase family protein [Spirosoma profusum]MBD2702405.1 SGNH/GDSL hydrolase family protein [Spirosoma profusum]
MNVLVIGDGHTYGYGLPGGKLSYIGHFIRQIKRSGQAVSVEAYAFHSMMQGLSTLKKLPLEQYDLIILQLDVAIIQPINPVRKHKDNQPLLPYLPEVGFKNERMPFVSRLKTSLGLLLTSVLPIRSRTYFGALLKQIRPYRHKVLLLTPFPNQHPLEQWLSQRSGNIMLSLAEKQLVSIFETNSVIGASDEYFLPDDSKHLSAVSHELLGRSLFDFYESAPTIVTVQTVRRGDKWFDV